MFSIGEFARHGRVSVRMLRHYDAIGLIRPACVDSATGYRFYQASQLDELNRVIALKDLGFTLQQVQAILDEKVSAAELRGMIKLRRAEIQATIDAETTRLRARRHLQMVFQDPFGSLDPKWRVRDLVEEPLIAYKTGDRTARRRRVDEVLELVGLAGHSTRRPRELSDGQAQRVAIARAVALNPALIICDEAVSSLDVLIQAHILGRLDELHAVGANTVYFHLYDVTDLDHVRLLGREVLPQVTNI